MYVIVKMVKQSPTGVELPVIILDNYEEILEFETDAEAEALRVILERNSDSGHKYLVKKMGMEPTEAIERTKQFGKDPSGNRTKNAPRQIRDKKGFIDRMTLSEIQRQKMIKAIDEILINKKNIDGELGEKEDKVSKIIKKNVDSLKKMAEKEGLTINQLIKMLKSE